MQINLTQFDMMEGDSPGATYVKVAQKGETVVGARVFIGPHPSALFAGFKLRIEGAAPEFENRKSTASHHWASYFMKPVCKVPAFHNWVIEEPWSEWALEFLAALKDLGYEILVDGEMFAEYVTTSLITTYPPVEKTPLPGKMGFMIETSLHKSAAEATGELYSSDGGDDDDDEFEEE